MGERAFGWLVVNRFLGTDKFRDIAARLVSAAEAHGARIALKYNDELLPALCGGAWKSPISYCFTIRISALRRSWSKGA